MLTNGQLIDLRVMMMLDANGLRMEMVLTGA